jgi:hypothetical protein
MTELLGAIQEVETAADYLKTQLDAIRDNEEIESGILREAIRHNKEKLEQLAKAAKMSRWLASLEGEQHVTTARDNRKIGL